MGWSSGTSIAEAVIKAVKANVVGKSTRKPIYVALINALEDADWDTQNEALGIDPIFDSVFKELHHDDLDSGEDE